MTTFKSFRRIVLACLLALILIIRVLPFGGEFYATCLYPYLSYGLSFISSFCPWSLEEILVCCYTALLILYPLIALFCRRKHILLGELEILLWIVVWFYMGWGCNYFRDSFYERLMIYPTDYKKDTFHSFLDDFTDNLNKSYMENTQIDKQQVMENIKSIFQGIPVGYGLTKPEPFQKPKDLLFNELYSQVGVLGYMGPFMSESQLNLELSDLEYPFTYAHELSHLLGVNSEAEANFWAFSVCSKSDIPPVRYSAYHGLLAYVAQNAKVALTEDEYENWMKTINPSILEDSKKTSSFWESRKNPQLNEIQNFIYNIFLKSNNIKDGMQNYSQVIGMIIAVRESQREPLRRQGRALSVKQ